MNKNWNIAINGKEMDNSDIIDAIVQYRDIDDLYDFLHPNSDNLIAYDNLCDIDKASSIIIDGINKGNKFGVLWDVDQDGISSGAIATKWLKHNKAVVKSFINQGKIHGLSGFNIQRLIENQIDILWIVDSIETNIDKYLDILSLGIKIVVSDHHIVVDKVRDLSKANEKFALVSSAINYPNPALSGSGVTWKLCMYMDEELIDDYAESLTDLAATGIVADMCDVSTNSLENRYICHVGFDNVQSLAISKINGNRPYNSQAVSFGVAPLVNAAMRTNNNRMALNMFLYDDDEEFLKASIKCLRKYKESQNLEMDSLMDSLHQEAQSQLNNPCMFFFIDSESDISGLLANRLISIYQKPIFVLKNRMVVDKKTGEVSKHEYTGSVRGIGVENFKYYVEQTGLGWSAGHENAFGFGVDVEDFDYFKELIFDQLKDITFVQSYDVDIELSAEQINTGLINQIKDINRISGTGFKPIEVAITNVDDYQVQYMSGGKHLKIVTPNMIFIQWNYQGDGSEFVGSLDFIGKLDSGYFGRTFYQQLIMSDWRYSNG